METQNELLKLIDAISALMSKTGLIETSFVHNGWGIHMRQLKKWNRCFGSKS